MPEELEPPQEPPQEPPPYTGTWTLDAYSPDDSTRIVDIRSFELTDAIWFVSTNDAITAVPLNNWGTVYLTQDGEP